MADSALTSRGIAGGVRLVVVAKKPDDARTIARIRGPHHLAMAKGEALAGHTH